MQYVPNDPRSRKAAGIVVDLLIHWVSYSSILQDRVSNASVAQLPLDSAVEIVNMLLMSNSRLKSIRTNDVDKCTVILKEVEELLGSVKSHVHRIQAWENHTLPMLNEIREVRYVIGKVPTDRFELINQN